MGKEKKQTVDVNQKETIFYNEILGIIQILFSIISIIKLGIVGLYSALIIKLIFGEWYFIINILFLINGIRMILFHEPLNYKNMRFIGIIFILFSLLTFSHFTFHQYIESYGMNNFKLTFSFYIDSFKNKDLNGLSGGGIIGSLIFYAFYSLFGYLGSIIVGGALLYSGISFLFQKTIYEFSISIFNKIKFIFNKIFKINKILKYEIAHHKYLYRLSPSDIKEETIINNEEEHVNILYKEIKKQLTELNIFYNSINKTISNHLIILTVNCFINVDIKKVFYHFKTNFPFPFLLRYDRSNKEIILYFEFTKKIPCSYSFINAFNNSNSNEIVLGINPFNKEIKYKLNENLLIIGDEKNDFFLSISLLIQNKTYRKKDVYFVSSNYYYENLFINKDFSFLEELYSIIEKRVLLFNNYGCSNFNEYQKKYNSKIKEIIILLDYFDEILNNELYQLYFHNIINLAKNAGVYIVGHITNDVDIDDVTLQLFQNKICLKNNYHLTNTLVSKDLIEQISKIEGVFLNLNDLTRIGLTLIINNDLKNLLKKIKKYK